MVCVIESPTVTAADVLHLGSSLLGGFNASVLVIAVAGGIWFLNHPSVRPDLWNALNAIACSDGGQIDQKLAIEVEKLHQTEFETDISGVPRRNFFSKLAIFQEIMWSL